MYEQISHSLLNEILEELQPNIYERRRELQHFYTRLGANFYAIHNLFELLYGQRDDFKFQMTRLVEALVRKYMNRSRKLKDLDLAREKDHNWFLSQQWVGMALYSAGFAGNLQNMATKTAYFQELGVNLVHIMPILKCPIGKSDGGYAVSDFRMIDERVGTLDDLQAIAEEFNKRDILMVLDVVVNHTSDEHEWAQKAIAGDKKYQDYYYIFENRDIPDMYEESMSEIFPESSPGNFTWNETMQKWVMTVFHDFQWDLNYSNPAVFIEMLDVILFWINQGADIIRLDAVAFLWKKMGTTCQNEREAHLLLQLMKDCCQVTAPGTLFIAEAIVAPVEIIKYFGEDAIIAKECEIAYNATFMALLWDAIATQNSKLLTQGLKSLPDKLERATWLNYVRCHDDIGLGFDDSDIRAAGYEPFAHRQFLIDFFTGNYPGSFANGAPFMRNDKTGDARISGSLASLAGLEKATQSGNEQEIAIAIDKILLLHNLVMAFGGIPLLYYGDEIGTFNDYGYLNDHDKSADSRWIHRPTIDWERAELRKKQGTIEHTLFTALKKMIAIRKETTAFADFNNRHLIDTNNEHLFAFMRFDHNRPSERVLVVSNFSAEAQSFDLQTLAHEGFGNSVELTDLYSGKRPAIEEGRLIVQPFHFYWLNEY
ncbi:alpha-amylase family glycosyl hydrolase [Methylobacter sp.]|jgi:amylosucrase|uniref:alpha-amylase family glycosyl hydrolase n=1 Tax=Methylobacter sp. TaxID=2051955 RepID=UPI003DA4291B